MMQNQDFCNGKLRQTLYAEWLECECGAAVPSNRPNHRAQKKAEQLPPLSQVSLQVPLFSFETA